MPYATVDNIRSKIPQLQLTATSRPTVEEVETLIILAGHELDAVIKSLGHTSPISEIDSPLSFMMAREMVKTKVAAEVLYIQHAGLRDADSLGAKAFMESWKGKLNRLKDPDDPFTFPSDILGDQDQIKHDIIAESMVTQDPDFAEEERITRDQVF